MGPFLGVRNPKNSKYLTFQVTFFMLKTITFLMQCFYHCVQNSDFLYGGDGTVGHVLCHGACTDYLHPSLEI